MDERCIQRRRKPLAQGAHANVPGDVAREIVGPQTQRAERLRNGAPCMIAREQERGAPLRVEEQNWLGIIRAKQIFALNDHCARSP